MNTKTRTLALCLGALLACATAALATPISAFMDSGVGSSINDQPLNTDQTSVSWTAVPGDLGIALWAGAGTAGESGDPFANAFLRSSATWAADGNSGTIGILYGWTAQRADKVVTNLGVADWSYTFMADATGNFEMDYGINGFGSSTFGLQGFSLMNNFDTAVNPPMLDAFNPTTSGLFVGAVTAGQTYTVSLKNSGNVSSENPFTLNGYVQAGFDWRVVPANSVPDSGSTAAMLGSALAGLAMLRRRLLS